RGARPGGGGGGGGGAGPRAARFTELRRRVLEIVWRSHAPIGAYDILQLLQAEQRAAAPPTVYRALDFLIEHGLVHRLDSLNAFVGCAHPERRHVSEFLICTACARVAELDDARLLSALEDSAAAANFAVRRLTIELQGLCPRCAEAAA
ncbi:MAG: transcriptional repressor, partial [Rhodospirillaceae bacterium]|nr:transcriptional repressor [Rhodospirillaceae bacterium]